MVYFLHAYYEIPQKMMGILRRNTLPNYFVLKRMNKLPELKNPIEFDVEVRKARIEKTDCLYNDIMELLISPKAYEVFKDILKDQVQFLDTIIHTTNGDITNYKLLNIHNCISGVDINNDKSSYYEVHKKMPIGPTRVWDCIILRENCFEFYHDNEPREKNDMIAKLQESGERAIVKDEFKRICEENNLKGFMFKTSEEQFADQLRNM